MQAAVWLYVALSILGAYDRFNSAVAETGVTAELRGNLYGSIYGIYFFGGSLSLIGLALSFEVAVRGPYRGTWFFWTSLLLALPVILLFPVGSVLSVVFIVYLIAKRREFLRRE